MRNKNNSFIFTFYVILILLTGSKSFADDFQSWNAIALAGDASDDGKWQYWFDGHLRFKDDASSLGVSIIRPAVGYRMNDSLTLWLGVARVTVDAPGNSIDEDRIWQQATFNIGDFLGGNVSGRTRLEQRFRDDFGDDTGHRIRQFIRWAKPINDNWSLVVWDELFVGLNDADWGQRSGFDQNRLFVGPAYHLTDKWRVEVGYLHNHINPASEAAGNQNNNNLSLTFFGSW